MELDELIKY